MASHPQSEPPRRPRGAASHAASRQTVSAARFSGASRPVRAATTYRAYSAADAVCPDCDGTGLRAASLDPYCSCVLTCRSCAGANVHQDRTVFLMQLAFGCGIGLATLAVVLL